MFESTTFPRFREEPVTGIYCIKHVASGKYYFGSTGNLYKRRWQHEYALGRGEHHNAELQAHYNQDPRIEFSYEELPDRTVATVHEQAMIDAGLALAPALLINAAHDAFACNRNVVPSEEARRKMSEAWTEERRKNHGGWSHSEEYKQKHRDAKAYKADPVIIGGVEYPSVRAAEAATGVGRMTILRRINSTSGKFPDYSYKFDSKID